jgi:hypothetical protein
VVSKFERNKDLAQEVVSTAAESVGSVAKIISGTVVDVTKQIAGTVGEARDHVRAGNGHEVIATTAETVGEIAKIITGSVAGVTREIGDTVTDGLEMHEATQKAKADDVAEAQAAADPIDDVSDDTE